MNSRFIPPVVLGSLLLIGVAVVWADHATSSDSESGCLLTSEQGVPECASAPIDRATENNMYGIDHITENADLILETAEYVKLLEDSYALVISSSKSGIYDLSNGEWHIDFGECSYEDFFMGEFVDLGDNLLFVPQYGILNYKSCRWLNYMEWALWCSRCGDYIEYSGGFEGETKGVYCISKDKVIMEYGATYKMSVISSHEDSSLNSDYILFASYGASAGGGGADDIYGEYVSPSWLPWNDMEGGTGLYDINEDRWIFSNESDIEYMGEGLLYVDGKGTYDLSSGRWLLENDENDSYYLMSEG